MGLIVFQFGFWATSRNRSAIQWRTVIIGLFIQQVIALFVLKSGAGFHTFKWLATLASDFLAQGLVGATFFFDADTVNNKHWFFVNVVCQFFDLSRFQDPSVSHAPTCNYYSSSPLLSSSLRSCRCYITLA